MFDGRYGDAGLLGPTIHHEDLAKVADELRARTWSTWFAEPERLAHAAQLTPLYVDLGDEDLLCNGTVVMVNAQLSDEQRRLCVLIGVAHHVLSSAFGAHTYADAVFFVAELVAPVDLVVRRGIQAALARRHVPAWFLLAWERSVADVPSSLTASSFQ